MLWPLNYWTWWAGGKNIKCLSRKILISAVCCLIDKICWETFIGHFSRAAALQAVRDVRPQSELQPCNCAAAQLARRSHHHPVPVLSSLFSFFLLNGVSLSEALSAPLTQQANVAGLFDPINIICWHNLLSKHDKQCIKKFLQTAKKICGSIKLQKFASWLWYDITRIQN